MRFKNFFLIFSGTVSLFSGLSSFANVKVVSHYGPKPIFEYYPNKKIRRIMTSDIYEASSITLIIPQGRITCITSSGITVEFFENGDLKYCNLENGLGEDDKPRKKDALLSFPQIGVQVRAADGIRFSAPNVISSIQVTEFLNGTFEASCPSHAGKRYSLLGRYTFDSNGKILNFTSHRDGRGTFGPQSNYDGTFFPVGRYNAGSCDLHQWHTTNLSGGAVNKVNNHRVIVPQENVFNKSVDYTIRICKKLGYSGWSIGGGTTAKKEVLLVNETFYDVDTDQIVSKNKNDAVYIFDLSRAACTYYTKVP